MKKGLLSAVLLVTLFGGTALAAGAVDPGTDPLGFFSFLYERLASGEYVVAFGAFLVGLVAVLRAFVFGSVEFFKTRLGGWSLSFGTAGVLAIGTALMAGEAVSMALMVAAASAALAASGGWEAIKDLLGLNKNDPQASK